MIIGDVIAAGTQSTGTYTLSPTARTMGWAVCQSGGAATLKFGDSDQVVTLPASTSWLEVGGSYQKIVVVSGTVAFVAFA